MTTGNGKSKFVVKSGMEVATRLTMILWGLYGSGKTTYAATAPGDKLWLSFDDSEHVAVMHRKDVKVLDLAPFSPNEIFAHGIGPNPYDLSEYLSNNRGIRTIVCDSLTSIQWLALKKSVDDKLGRSDKFDPTMADPGRSAYMGRNAYLIGLMKSMLVFTAKHRLHLIFTAHESDPITIMQGKAEVVDTVKMTLGGQLINHVSAAISEIWNLRQETHGRNERVITTRVYGKRKPMKTRIFDQTGPAAFNVIYDPRKPDMAPGQLTIARFWEDWQKSGMQKLQVPNNKRGDGKEGTVRGPNSDV